MKIHIVRFDEIVKDFNLSPKDAKMFKKDIEGVVPSLIETYKKLKTLIHSDFLVSESYFNLHQKRFFHCVMKVVPNESRVIFHSLEELSLNDYTIRVKEERENRNTSETFNMMDEIPSKLKSDFIK